jgi:hypothetical protein
MRSLWAVALFVCAGLFADRAGPTPDQLRITLPQDEVMRLVGLVRDRDGTTRFATVSLGSSMWSIRVKSDAAHVGEIHLDLGSLAYRAIPPTAPGPCKWEGTGAFAVTPTAIFACTPDDARGSSFSWTRFTGGEKTW